MVETLIAKVGRKTFQGIANRQRRTARRRPVQPGATHAHRPNLRRCNGHEHDYLHIFFHPDYDRRPWHFTRSADPAHALPDTLGHARRGRSRARRLTLSRCRHTAGGDFHPALKTH
jgi:hypothetical protein